MTSTYIYIWRWVIKAGFPYLLEKIGLQRWAGTEPSRAELSGDEPWTSHMENEGGNQDAPTDFVFSVLFREMCFLAIKHNITGKRESPYFWGKIGGELGWDVGGDCRLALAGLG